MSDLQKEKQLLENEALALEKVQHALMHVSASMTVLLDEQPSPKALDNAHRLEIIAARMAEASGIIEDAQKRLRWAIGVY